jgi:CMP-N-acetylneuraminic acid synthetase
MMEKVKRDRIVALIPLRGGSKSILKKNIKFICGRPLCAWVLDAAVNSELIDSVYVSTDSKEIADVVINLNMGIKIIDRPSNLSTDKATTESVMLHAMKIIPFDSIVTIQATSPLLESAHIDNALVDFETLKYDSMLSAVRVKRFFWTKDGLPINYNPISRPMRQDFEGTFMENGAFYITKRSVLKNLECRVGGVVGIFEMDEKTAVEIDEPNDWTIVENLLEERIQKSK